MKVRIARPIHLFTRAPEDLPVGELGEIVETWPADDTIYVVVFDSLPDVRVEFHEPNFMEGSPEYCLDVVSSKHCSVDPECLLGDGHRDLCYVDPYA